MLEPFEKTKKIKVVYCMGSGRSGSTLLGIILANHPEILGPGELNEIHRLNEKEFKCSCSKRVEECSFWSNVITRWNEVCGESLVMETISNVNKFENFKSPIAWLKCILNYPGQNKKFKDYLDCTYEFYRIMSTESNKSIIVDISKNPLRALILSKHSNLDIRLIHLVRDGRGVAWSLKKGDSSKRDQRSIWRSAIFWLIVNWQSNFVRKRSSKSSLIKYEDLVLLPDKTLKIIGDLAGFDSFPINEKINNDLALDEAHIMAGNQLRRHKTITLKLNTEWEDRMPSNKKNVFMNIAGRTLKSYGYN